MNAFLSEGYLLTIFKKWWCSQLLLDLIVLDNYCLVDNLPYSGIVIGKGGGPATTNNPGLDDIPYQSAIKV